MTNIRPTLCVAARAAVVACIFLYTDARGDTVDTLIAQMTSETGGWEEHLAAANAIKAMEPSREMLERLFPALERFGGNWNPGSSFVSSETEVPNQIGFLVRETFHHHTCARNSELTGKTIAKLFPLAKQERTQQLLLGELYWNYSDDAEKLIVDYFVKNKDNESAKVLIKWTNHAGLVLEQIENNGLPQGKRERLLQSFDGNVFFERLSVATRHRLIMDAFELLEDHVNDPSPLQAFELAVFLQRRVKQRFAPDPGLFKYRESDNRLKESFYRETIQNAHDWWQINRKQFEPKPNSRALEVFGSFDG